MDRLPRYSILKPTMDVNTLTVRQYHECISPCSGCTQRSRVKRGDIDYDAIPTLDRGDDETRRLVHDARVRERMEFVKSLNAAHRRAWQDCPDLRPTIEKSMFEIRDGVVYDGTGVAWSVVDNERRCSICFERARVPFDECWFCGQSPSWHHGRCCPDKPRRHEWFEWPAATTRRL